VSSTIPCRACQKHDVSVSGTILIHRASSILIYTGCQPGQQHSANWLKQIHEFNCLGSRRPLLGEAGTGEKVVLAFREEGGAASAPDDGSVCGLASRPRWRRAETVNPAAILCHSGSYSATVASG
jgi:hypothetical protein